MAYAIEDRETLAQAVIDTMVIDGLSLRKATAKHQISPQTVLRAVAASPALAEQYDRARAAVIERYADEILELADAPVPVLDNGGIDGALVRQRLMQVDVRKWFLSKLAPKVYGDRLDVSVTDSRISITGALQAAQSRLVDVIDVPCISLADAENANENEGPGRAKG